MELSLVHIHFVCSAIAFSQISVVVFIVLLDESWKSKNKLSKFGLVVLNKGHFIVLGANWLVFVMSKTLPQ